MEAAGTVSLPSRRAIQGGPRVLDGNEALTFEDIGLSQERDAYRCRNSPVSSAQSQGVDERESEEKRREKEKLKIKTACRELSSARPEPPKRKPFLPLPPTSKRKTNVRQKRLGVKMS